MDVRLLNESDADSSILISEHAFGVSTGPRPAFTLGPEVRRWGIFDGALLVAKANDRSYDSWIGGRRIPTAGVAGVAVVPEYRGAGLALQVMTHLLTAARDRGVVIATLFRTAPALYRSLGFEQVASMVDGELPAAALRGLRAAGILLRRASVADAADIRRIYSTVAATGSALLSRDGASFPHSDEDLLGAVDGITLAVDTDGAVVGYVSWDRGPGYGGAATLRVVELLALSGDAHRALLAAVGSFEAVTPTLRFRTSGDDPLHWLIPGAGWTVTEVQPYMLRVIDAAAAVAARGWPAGLTAELTLRLDDPVCPWNTGTHRLTIAGGRGELVPAAAGAVPGAAGVTSVTPPGLAVLYAGGVSVATLRRAGLVIGGTPAADARLDAAFAGPTPSILDYF